MVIETKYSVSEANLQAYRGIFISSQSFLLTTGAIMYDKSALLFNIIFAFSIINIWLLWFRVVNTRSLIVDYYKYQIDSNMTVPCTEYEYINDKEKRNDFNNMYGIKRNLRMTRVKLDIILPALFTLVWLSIFIYANKHLIKCWLTTG